MNAAAPAVVCVLLAGCAALVPVGVPIELDHTSHLTQHAPFTDTPTRYGYNAVAVGLHWQPAERLSVVATEGWNLSPSYPQAQLCGALKGPREVFQARITYEVPLRAQ
jgi:hypothetical protein